MNSATLYGRLMSGSCTIRESLPKTIPNGTRSFVTVKVPAFSIEAASSDAALDYRLTFDPDLYYWTEDYECKKGKVRCFNAVSAFLCRHLDVDDAVESFGECDEEFEYYDAEKDRPVIGFFAMEAMLVDGRRQLIFTTSQNFLFNQSHELIIEAAEAHAESIGCNFLLFTEMEIFGPKSDYVVSLVSYVKNKSYLQFEPTSAENF